METIKEPLQEVEHRAVEIYCPHCKGYRELYMAPVKVSGAFPVKLNEEGHLYWDTSDTREFSFTPVYICQACGREFLSDEHYLKKLLKDEET